MVGPRQVGLRPRGHEAILTPRSFGYIMNIFEEILAFLAEIAQFTELFTAILTFLSFFGLNL
jgi:hypothetical protein